MRVSSATRELVLARDEWRCFRCRAHVGGPDAYSIHHRKPRGMGGTKRPEINQPANLLTLCGTGTTGCHGNVESYRSQAKADGFLIFNLDDAARKPVKTPTGWVLLDNEGGMRPAFPHNCGPTCSCGFGRAS